MTLDLQSTGLTAASFLLGIGALALTFARQAERSTGTGPVGWGTLCTGLGLLALSLRGMIPLSASVLLGNTLLLLGLSYLDRGCRRFEGLPARVAFMELALPAAQCAVLVAFLTMGFDAAARAALVSACMLVVTGRWGLHMRQHFQGPRRDLPRRILRYAPWAVFGLSAATLALSLSRLDGMPTLQAGGWLLFAAVLLLCGVVSSVALAMLWLEIQTELAAALDRTQSILSVLPDLLTIQDRSGRFLEVPETIHRTPSLRALRLAECGPEPSYPPEVARARLGCILEALNTGELQVIEYPLEVGGTTLWLEARVIPYRRDQVLTLVRDVTERKDAERLRAENEATLRLITENMGDIIALYHPDGTLRYVSPSIKKVLGYEPAEVLGLTPYEAIHPDDIAQARMVRDQVLQGRPPRVLQYRMRNRTGEYLWMEVRGQPIFGPDERPVSYITSSHDITERRTMEEQLRLAAMVAHSASEAIVVSRADGIIQWVNNSFVTMTGYSRRDAVGAAASTLLESSPGPAERATRQETLTKEGFWEGEIMGHRKGGENYPASYRVSAVRDEEGHTTHYVHVVSDRSREAQTRQIIEHLARHDGLTKLPNRAYFIEALNDAITDATARSETLALLSINLDRFKRLNGLLGQADGDRLLQRIAQRLVALLDPARSVVARVGGDEFVILLTGLVDASAAGNAAHAVMETLARPFDLGFEDDVFVTSSIGIGVFPDDATTSDAIMKASTTAMYHAKRGGGNAYRFFSVEMDSRDAGQLLTEARLRRAAESKEGLSMAYQPKLGLPERRITGIEALIRWQQADGGSISPVQFIPLAEDLGLIPILGEWVLRTVCREAMARHDAGFEPLRVAVNLSAKQLMDEELPEKIQAILTETGLDPQWLELEVTETCVMTARDQAARLLERLRRLGIRLCLDDFGTGHSSLSYLSSLPVDSIKIDRSFVTGLPAKQTSVAICKAVLAMGGALGLKIVAEGVERPEELRFLEDHECDEIQGNLIGQPMSDESLRRFLVSQEAHPRLQQA
jgi:diguanylate cyclase (GGDEF)-like protein/PAS domain S-box-containing protein